jgi:hypothetical protein
VGRFIAVVVATSTCVTLANTAQRRTKDIADSVISGASNSPAQLINSALALSNKQHIASQNSYAFKTSSS